MTEDSGTDKAVQRLVASFPPLSFVLRHWQACFLVGEFLLDLIFIWNGPFHAIDFDAYLDQVAQILRGERQYDHVRGRTGPLVYPAGHVLIFTVLNFITQGGTLRLLAQLIFMGVQLLTSYFVSEIYKMASPTPYVALFLWCTMRARNVFVNGLFNDCFEMLFIYLAIYLLLKNRLTLSVLSFSAAASVKMSALLYAPGALLVFVRHIGWPKTLKAAVPAVILQVVLGFPFMRHNMFSYMSKSFELSRSFAWFLSHTWKFLPETVFDSRTFHVLLLALHLFFLGLVIHRRGWLQGIKLGEPADRVFCIFVCNFIGVVFARSLHYSFYLWYFHTLPLILVYHGRGLQIWHPAFLISVEVCWNQWWGYDRANPLYSCASWKASLVLTLLHLFLLGHLLQGTRDSRKGSLLPLSQEKAK